MVSWKSRTGPRWPSPRGSRVSNHCGKEGRAKRGRERSRWIPRRWCAAILAPGICEAQLLNRSQAAALAGQVVDVGGGDRSAGGWLWRRCCFRRELGQRPATFDGRHRRRTLRPAFPSGTLRRAFITPAGSASFGQTRLQLRQLAQTRSSLRPALDRPGPAADGASPAAGKNRRDRRRCTFRTGSRRRYCGCSQSSSARSNRSS